jgi:hypothetical protein
MHGNVNNPLKLSNGDKTVDAKGWMQWDAGETSAVFTVAIAQPPVSGGGADTYTPPQTTWDIDVDSAGGDKFQKGPATASVTAVVSKPDSTTTIHWTAPVQLD